MQLSRTFRAVVTTSGRLAAAISALRAVTPRLTTHMPTDDCRQKIKKRKTAEKNNQNELKIQTVGISV